MKNNKYLLMSGFLLAFSILHIAAMAQDQGIHFEHGLSWQQVKEKARQENKFIFMDCYTTWCGPCKVMSKNIFPQKVAGDFFNANFINVKVQFDKTDSDQVEIKNWYEDADKIGKEYNVLAYPTFLYFAPNGELVHLFVGSTNTAEEFISASANALDTSKQYYARMKRILGQAHGNPDVLRELVMESLKQYDGLNSAKLVDMYLRTQKNLLTKENLTLLNDFTKKSSDYGFEVFVNETEKVNSILGNGVAQRKLTNIVYKEEGAMDWLSKRDDAGFAEITKKIKEKYPAQADMLSAQLKLVSYQAGKQSEAYLKNVIPFVKKYGKNLGTIEMRGIVSYISGFGKDATILKQAIIWNKALLKEDPSPGNMSTEALLLYKAGNKKEAIAAQQKAMAALSEKEKQYQLDYYQNLLTKMEKGEKF